MVDFQLLGAVHEVVDAACVVVGDDADEEEHALRPVAPSTTAAAPSRTRRPLTKTCVRRPSLCIAAPTVFSSEHVSLGPLPR